MSGTFELIAQLATGAAGGALFVGLKARRRRTKLSGPSPFGEWFAECVKADASAITPAGELYASYKAWCAAQGIARPMSQTAFGNAVADRQVIRAGKNSQGQALRRGAVLRRDPVQTATAQELNAQLFGSRSGGRRSGLRTLWIQLRAALGAWSQ